MTPRTSCRTCGPSMDDDDAFFISIIGIIIGVLIGAVIMSVLSTPEAYDPPPGYYYDCGGSQVVKVDGEYIKGKSCDVARKE